MKNTAGPSPNLNQAAVVGVVPEIAHIFQPLSGEYGQNKVPSRSIRFFLRYGVEIGLIFDIYKKFGLDTFAQVKWVRGGTAMDRARTGENGGSAILQTPFRKLELEDVAGA